MTTKTSARNVDLDRLRLGKGSHGATDLTDAEKAASEQACIMEAVAYVAGEPWSDRPACASPVLTTYGMGLNDALPTDRRQELVPLIPRIIGTAGDGQDAARSYLALDWLIRVYTPTWLRLVPALVSDADAIAGMPRIVDLESAAAIGDMVRNASVKAAAAWAAARRDAARGPLPGTLPGPLPGPLPPLPGPPSHLPSRHFKAPRSTYSTE